MVLKLIDATEIHPGTIFTADGETYSAKSNDVSKTGKHGASKCRIEAVNLITGKKKIVAVPGGDRFEVPLIIKKRAQVLSVLENSASVMDMESYETIELPFVEEIRGQLAPEQQVEYWDIEGKKIIMRIA